MACFTLLTLSLTSMLFWFTAVLARPLEHIGFEYSKSKDGSYDRAYWRQERDSANSITADRVLEPEVIEDQGWEAGGILRSGESIFDRYRDLGLRVGEPKILGRRAEPDVSALMNTNEKTNVDGARNTESSTGQDQSSEEEDDGRGASKAPGAYVIRKMSGAKTARLKPRQETPKERKQLEAELLEAEKRLEALHEGYLTYAREYLGEKNKVKRAKLKAGELPAQEIEDWENLRKIYNDYQGAQYKIVKLKSRLGTPAEIRRLEDLRKARNTRQRDNYQRRQAKAGLRTPEELVAERLEGKRLEGEGFETLLDGYITYKREYGGTKNQSRRTRLSARKGKPEEVQRFETLRKRHNAFRRLYLRQHKRGRGARSETGYHTAEELEQLQALREDHNTYQREYFNNPAKKARLKARKGKPDELKRFDALREAYNAFKRLYHRGKNRGKTPDVHIDRTLVEDIKQLEALREEHDTYVREFLGESNRDKKAALESDQGSKEEIDRFKALREAFRAYREVYERAYRKAEKNRRVPNQDKPEEDGQAQLRGVGRRRYFQPNYRTRAKLKKNKPQSERDPARSEETGDSVQEEVNDQTEDSKDTQRFEASTGEDQVSNKGTQSPENATPGQFFSTGISDLWSGVSAGASRMFRNLGAVAVRTQDAITRNGASSSMRGSLKIPASGLPKLMPRVPI